MTFMYPKHDFDARDYDPEELTDHTSSGEMDWVPPYYVTWLDLLCFGLMNVAAWLDRDVWSNWKIETRHNLILFRYTCG